MFSNELRKRPVAMNHYCAHLRQVGDFDELHEAYSAFGRTEEAAMLKYTQTLAATTKSSSEIRTAALDDCYK